MYRNNGVSNFAQTLPNARTDIAEHMIQKGGKGGQEKRARNTIEAKVSQMLITPPYGVLVSEKDLAELIVKLTRSIFRR